MSSRCTLPVVAGDEAAAEQVLEKGIDIEAKDLSGWAVLNWTTTHRIMANIYISLLCLLLPVLVVFEVRRFGVEEPSEASDISHPLLSMSNH